MLKTSNVKKFCCVAVATILSISLCACKEKKGEEALANENTITTTEMTTETTVPWYNSVQEELRNKPNVSNVYRVVASNTRVYDADEGKVPIYFFNYNDTFVTDGDIGAEHKVKIKFKNRESGEIIEGFVIFDENTRNEFYELIN